MDKLRILKMAHIHVDQIFEIEEQSFFTPWSRHSIRQEVDNPLGRYIVIVEEDTVAAYGGFWLVEREANINNIAVAPAFRGRGIAKLLMQDLIDRASSEGAEDMYLEVRTGNRTAQNLYRSFGFKMVGLRRGYYVDTDEDAIVMHLALK